MTPLLGLVILYLLGTLAIGLMAARKVKTSTDFALAGRSLPLIMIITTTFATWFGSETVLGISAKFVQGHQLGKRHPYFFAIRQICPLCCGGS